MAREQFWPARHQVLLLRSALLGDRSAYAGWSSEVRLARLDAASIEILPLLFQAQYGDDRKEDPLLHKAKSVYRHTLYSNRILFHRVGRLLKALDAAGIPILVLKGAALLPLFYKDYGLRPMRDFDMMVPSAGVREAISVLLGCGFRPDFFDDPASLTREYLRVRHSHGFTNRNGVTLDLHWRPFLEWNEADQETDFWKRAVAWNECGIEAGALEPADQLFNILVHGVQWNPSPSLRWIADAKQVIDSFSGPEWDRLLKRCRDQRLVAPVRDGLAYLGKELGLAIPPEVGLRFGSSKVSRREAREHRAKLEPLKRLGWLPALWYSHRRLSPGQGLLPALVSFPGHLRHAWMLNSWSQMPAAFFKKLRRKTRRFV